MIQGRKNPGSDPQILGKFFKFLQKKPLNHMDNTENNKTIKNIVYWYATKNYENFFVLT